MIARVWSAHAHREKLQIYWKHFSGQALPTLNKCDGCVSAIVLTRQIDAEDEILVTTFRKSMDAIDVFAGSHREDAVVVTEAAALLCSFDRRVRHYTVDVAVSRESVSIFAGRD